jgi:hypothetical protein
MLCPFASFIVVTTILWARSRPELNRDTRIRNPLLYPFELREHPALDQE